MNYELNIYTNILLAKDKNPWNYTIVHVFTATKPQSSAFSGTDFLCFTLQLVAPPPSTILMTSSLLGHRRRCIRCLRTQKDRYERLDMYMCMVDDWSRSLNYLLFHSISHTDIIRIIYVVFELWPRVRLLALYLIWITYQIGSICSSLPIRRRLSRSNARDWWWCVFTPLGNVFDKATKNASSHFKCSDDSKKGVRKDANRTQVMTLPFNHSITEQRILPWYDWFYDAH